MLIFLNTAKKAIAHLVTNVGVACFQGLGRDQKDGVGYGD
jgi:hypothetical protein